MQDWNKLGRKPVLDAFSEGHRRSQVFPAGARQPEAWTRLGRADQVPMDGTTASQTDRRRGIHLDIEHQRPPFLEVFMNRVKRLRSQTLIGVEKKTKGRDGVESGA
jgi:hypothetical protein